MTNLARHGAHAILAGLAIAAALATARDPEPQPPTQPAVLPDNSNAAAQAEALADATYVGGKTCAECHQPQFKLWHGSHHDRAMELATPESVLGDFNDAKFERLGVTTRFFRRDGKYFVNTEGPDGKYHDYEIKYTFGVDPLQQYMVEFPKGRVQVLRVSWDTNKKRWFEVTPPDAPDERLAHDDPLHWTGIAQNWNTTCAECHSTNLQKNYDLKTDTFHTTYSEIDVSCEECHGPGSKHVELARAKPPDWDGPLGYGLARLKGASTIPQIETCAKCHSRRVAVHDNFRPGMPLLDYYEPSLLTAGLYHEDGQINDEVYEYGSFTQSKMYANRVRCSDCHDPHSLQLKFPGNKLCTQCHKPEKYDTPDHFHHPVDSAGAECVACHMPTRTYMVIDARRDHSLRVPRPDLSVLLGTPNACNDCHTKPNETPQWAAGAVRKWYGDNRLDDPRWAPAFAAANRNLPEGIQLLDELIRRPTTPAIVKATAVSLTAQYPGEQAVALQQLALADSDPLVRMAAIRALAGGPSLQEILAQLGDRLSDPVRSVRMAAARRLVTMPRDQLEVTYRKPFEQALDEYRDAQKLSYEHAHPHINLGWLARQLGNTQQAIDQFRTAIRLEPYLTGPRTELATVLAQQNGDAAEIRKLREEEAGLLERDSKLLPDNAEILYRLGLMRYLLGELDAASTALTKSCDLAPTSYEYRMALALLQERRYEQTGNQSQFEAAYESLEKLKKMQPQDPRAGQIMRRLLNTRAIKQAGGKLDSSK